MFRYAVSYFNHIIVSVVSLYDLYHITVINSSQPDTLNLTGRLSSTYLPQSLSGDWRPHFFLAERNYVMFG